ncbi:oxygenase MpaB family protein [Gordonia amicalis]|uniref:Oxygenase MpaB family protein n=1 Tax=Gordonia amicalis TaxID=89053 RepID=A0ABU4DI68_9ACTN|nr:oxygenase MpaB family protein [Gordonia amicalis]MDV6309435.1 oxygenase MpaB family protein [Gordonia amicalis]MDV7101940.1 oxygenase MpaB family protein [Gordonia amicalis]
MTVLDQELDPLAPLPAPDAPIDPVLGRPLRPAPTARPRFNPGWTPARRRLLDGWVDVQDRLPETDGIVARAKDHLWVGDPEMDAVVQMFRRLPPRTGRDMFERALSNGLETIENPPEELVALFEHIDNPPAWITKERVDRGAIVANSVSPAGKASLIFLNTLATVQGGSVGDAVGTMGRMQRDMIDRSLESAEFWLHLPAPGALDRFGTAFKNAVRVCLMHAQARVMLRKKWGEEWVVEHGVPISNAEMSGGITSFGVANLMYDINYGRRYDHRDLEDLNIFWSYIGHIMGIREAMIPRNFSEAVELLDCGYAVMEPPSEFSEALNDVSEMMLTTLLDKVTVPLVDAQVKSALQQTLYGLYFFIGGTFLGRRITGTPEPSRIGRIAPKLITAQARLANLDRRIPGYWKRADKRRANGDTYWALMHDAFTKLAAEQDGGRGPTFAGHDKRVEALGKAG